MNLSIFPTKIFQWSLLLFFIGTLCSFSATPTPATNKTAPPIEKKATNKRQQRLNKRYNRLHKRFDTATNSKQRLHLQKKIRQVERQQEGKKAPILGIFGMVLGILSFILAIWCIIGIIAFPQTLLALFITTLTIAITSLVLSILSIKKDDASFRGLGIVGIVFAGISLTFGIIVGLTISFIYSLR
ncbi:MAG: hypothetical protein ACRBFS_12410 [Aureispira sp.]